MAAILRSFSSALFVSWYLALVNIIFVNSVRCTSECPSQHTLIEHGNLSAYRASDLNKFIAVQSHLCLSRILCNIGPEGLCAPGASSGLVVAGPGKVNPDYYYSWTRDSALTFKYLVDRLATNYDRSLQIQVENYISAQARLQTVINPSGDLSNDTGAGLGEPKFHVDASPFAKPWGRPQRDGPALRAITLITYSKWLIGNGYKPTASKFIWPIILNDLNYVAQYWNQTGFDIWEEVEGSSFFTLSTQHRALVEGSILASLLGKICSSCDLQAPQVLCFLQSFWNPSKGYILSNLNEDSGRSSRDSSTILASIHQFDPSAECDSRTFQPCSDFALANHKMVTDSFRSIYPLNTGILEGKAISVGRYPEDVYYNGNPWYLTSLAAAEQLYDALYIWKEYRVINITKVSLLFFRDFLPKINIGKFSSETIEYQNIYRAVSIYADDYMRIVERYTQINGSLSEQFDKVTGKPLSANDLTWSYTAFLTATDRRIGKIPQPWGINMSRTTTFDMPSVCVANTGKGSYAAAPEPIWPENQTPPGYDPIPIATSTPCEAAVIVLVTFNVLVATSFGDTIKISGSISKLGNWSLQDSPILSASDYSSKFPIWRVTVPLEPGLNIKYKYVNIKSDSQIDWESGEDHNLTLPRSCESAISVTETWK